MGLRERRKQAVFTAVERIAVDLALEVGVEQVTIEAICERALISNRTFYNYFSSKEAAMFGTEPQPSHADLEAFRAGTSEDIVGDLLELFAKTVAADSDPELFRDRRRLLKQDHALALRVAPKSFSALTDLTLDRLRAMQPFTSESDLSDEAAMIVALTTAVMQRSMHAQLEADDDTEPRAVLDHSIALARRVLSKGQK